MTDAIVTWSVSANDNVDGTILPVNIICDDGASNILMSGENYPVGTTTVTCRANDTALNEGSCEFNITVTGRCFFIY